MSRPSTLRFGLAALFVLLIALALSGQGEQTMAVEIGQHNTNLLPAGKEADGIIGDFVLRNGIVLTGGGATPRKVKMFMHEASLERANVDAAGKVNAREMLDTYCLFARAGRREDACGRGDAARHLAGPWQE